MVETSEAQAAEKEDGESSPSAAPDESDKKLLEVARARFKLAAEAQDNIRRLALEDLKFRAGDQWPEKIKMERDRDDRPCLTVNRMPQYIQQITNDQRQNRPSIKVRPVDDRADIDTAKIIQGMIKHIESNSNADVAYDTAFDGAVTGGFGWFRIRADYTDPMGFDQELRVEMIKNPFMVYPDPATKQPDGSDLGHGFIVEDQPDGEFKVQYPDAEPAGADEFESIGDQAANWKVEGCVRVAEYFYIEHKNVEIVQLSNGEIGPKAKLPAVLPPGLNIVQERTARVPTVKWAKITANQVLEKRDLPISKIPLIPVYGVDLDVNGERILEGVIRHAKDPQKMYNVWKSYETETIALAPRTPFIGAEGQFKGHEPMWKTANKKNHPYLQYTPVSLNGVAVPPPQRQVFEPAIGAITQAAREASEDIKATTGIYDAAMGARSNETSGVAIQRRNQQAQTSNFHFVDNLHRSLRFAGRILLEWIPYVYDTARAVRIIGEEGEEEVVKINQFFEKGGEQKAYNMGIGKYDVAMDTGPSYATRRQESADSMLDLSNKNPKIMEVAGDLVVKALDLAGADEISERLKKTLPPGLIDDKEKKPLPPEVQAQMQQSGQMIEVLKKQLNDANQKIKMKTLELESKERIELKKREVQVELKLAELDQAASREILQAELAQINQRQADLRAFEPIENEIQDSGPEGAFEPEQTPTGGPSPGNPMEQMP